MRCEIGRSCEASLGHGWARSDGKRQFVEGDAKTFPGRLIDSDLVVAPSDILDEGMTGGEDASRAESLEAAHRSKPGFESTMVRLDPVIRILLGGMESTRNQLVEDPRIRRCPVGGDLDRQDPQRQCPAEELPRSGEVTPT